MAAPSRPAARLRAGPKGKKPRVPEGDPLIGRSRAITRVLEQIQRIATTHAAVLIEGEPGTGKGWAARAIHDRGPRHAAAFVALGGAEFAPTEEEAALFGAQAAGRATPGAVERAEGGTLYLAEVGALSHAVQARLLRLLQERAFERIGGERTLHADVRLIAGTRQDLAVAAREGRFRDDLLARIAAARITMPPLRDRVEDIPALVERFLREANRRHRRGVKRVTRGVLERLQRHLWPGNVRELADLPQPLRVDPVAPESVRLAPGMTVEEAVRALIVATLEDVGQDRRRAAAMLGIGLRTLYRKIKQYGIG